MRKSFSSLPTALFVLVAAQVCGLSVSRAADADSRGTVDRLFDDRPEYYFMDRPSFEYGARVGHISSIKQEKDLVFNGGIRYSKENGKLNDWVDTTYNNKQAWLHSRGARAALSRLGVGDPARELKRITAPKTAVAAAAAPAGPTSTWQYSNQQYSFGSRAPAAQMPLSAGFHNGTVASAASLAPYQGLVSSTSSAPTASAGGAGSSVGGGANAPADPKATWTNPTGVQIPICAKSKAEYDENKILQKAFEGSKNPFTAWSDPANDASLSPNGQGQWDFIVQGAVLKTLPIQVCVEKEGAEPYLSVWNKRFDIKENGTVQTVYLEDVEGHNGTFSQQAAEAQGKASSTKKTVR